MVPIVSYTRDLHAPTTQVTATKFATIAQHVHNTNFYKPYFHAKKR